MVVKWFKLSSYFMNIKNMKKNTLNKRILNKNDFRNILHSINNKLH